MFLVLAATVALLVAFPARAVLAATSAGVTFSSLEDFDNTKMGMLTGSYADSIVSGRYDNVTKEYFDSYADMIPALTNGEVDSIAAEEMTATNLVRETPGLAIFPTHLVDTDYAFGLQKGSALAPQVNAAIDRLKADGTIDALKAKWVTDYTDDTAIDASQYAGYDTSAGTLRYAIDSSKVPMDYVGGDGSPEGFDVELCYMVAKELHMAVSVDSVKFASLLPGLQSDQYDIVSAALSVTDERKESIDFSAPYMTAGQVLIVRQGRPRLEHDLLCDDGDCDERRCHECCHLDLPESGSPPTQTLPAPRSAPSRGASPTSWPGRRSPTSRRSGSRTPPR
jgi:polar amino acid transport system substrate-binding protein